MTRGDRYDGVRTHDGRKNNQGVSERRRHARKPVGDAGCLQHRRDTLTCQLIDVSSSGAQVVCRRGLVPTVGEPVRLQLPDGATVVGRTAWLGPSSIGIEFANLEGDILDRLDATCLGQQNFSRILKMQLLLQGDDRN